MSVEARANPMASVGCRISRRRKVWPGITKPAPPGLEVVDDAVNCLRVSAFNIVASPQSEALIPIVYKLRLGGAGLLESIRTLTPRLKLGACVLFAPRESFSGLAHLVWLIKRFPGQSEPFCSLGKE
jgi:hypothetical protein